MTAVVTEADTALVAAASVKRRPRPGGWLAVLPLLVFVAVAFGLPAVAMLNGAFTVKDQATGATSYTTANMTASVQGAYLTAMLGSVKLSAVSAGLAALLGLPLAQAVVTSRFPALREAVLTASGVLANFGGVPLAFAFVATLGNAGVLTRRLGLTDKGWDLYSFWGLVIVYLYFLIPLMVLTITPALDGLRVQWREAAQNNGATGPQYWIHVALPVLAPSLLGGLVLLFGSAFAAYATAAAMVGSSIPLVTLQIADAISGNVLVGQENVALALSLDMVLIAGLVMAVYLPLQRRSARWLA
ncbi:MULTISPECIES: ABC transporter permease [Streptomyces]|uniref:Putative spermidine/putrescine transport system permease protein n=1 Tax=Streptomyces stelliscabiei TaxID=146820 RepID=A0A8I0TPS8_9ACTN|nr:MULTISPECIES: ABC transporter permease subunit [Streptomyces]KND43337.1 ABC transporter permease [Streptomyces stelliscabiei]MBE1595672.1 putative spermidine/putrescine transport system permease protein [Streptomyces stelliscabiei]MDX2517686.1 ABC transporter permease subunit [Streptomyces stelliscabiei]MDX2555500.1 ABC transporter permease subunit [Streptomyces stelliscabiei]MDX2614018.1 ABC transporter permease subunit [Streptomyces stelliscabiei]